jgi:hypothetical protein
MKVELMVMEMVESKVSGFDLLMVVIVHVNGGLVVDVNG